ncbi:hypothetical protein CSOJ01_09084 [Colletotrichum sojae]|uniref:Uncharacterized protein n=1 Tax=Colletotrichum sojae TaxID=2175907 RepID=A0A8H6J4K0_9PEZI|nr:hypothetical protein CSOJ01_09084 [Colletotrichum sojae]
MLFQRPQSSTIGPVAPRKSTADVSDLPRLAAIGPWILVSTEQDACLFTPHRTNRQCLMGHGSWVMGHGMGHDSLDSREGALLLQLLHHSMHQSAQKPSAHAAPAPIRLQDLHDPSGFARDLCSFSA